MEEDCPLCLEPLPPFWDVGRRVTNVCCGKSICGDCTDQRDEFLGRAVADGSFGRGEEQLYRTCALCRARRPQGNAGAMMADRFEKGQLPLSLYGTLGLLLVKGEGGLERDVERGTEIWRLGANKGDPMCQCNLGSRYYKGTDGLPKSTTEAKRWWLAAAEQGHAIAESALALILKDEGNDAEFLRYMRGSASKGYDEACYILGVAHFKGEHGLQTSSEEAIRVLQPAAERGHAKSMSLLGRVMCKLDPELPLPLPRDNPNLAKGMHWLRRVAATGDPITIAKIKAVEEWASSICFRCNKEAPPETAFLRCSRCRAAWYCSKDCQVQHWRAKEAGHKHFCIKWK